VMRSFRRARASGRSGTRVPAFLASAVLALGVVSGGSQALAVTATHSWAMNEPDGTGTMADTGTTPTPGSWRNIDAGAPGFTGTAYVFNGSSSRVTVGDNASLDPGSTTFTTTVHVSFTTVPTASNGGDYDLIRKGLSSTSGGYWKVEIYPDGSRALALCQMKGSSNSVKIVNAPRSLNDGHWHTITCTKTDTTVTLQVDGSTYRKSVRIGSIANSAPLTLGAKSSGGDWYRGVMDDVTLRIG
jgi:hypothetical protein